MILDKFRYAFMSRMRRAEGLPPKVDRDPRKTLGASPAVIFEVSTIASLSLVIFTFLFFPRFDRPKNLFEIEQEFVKFEEIEKTRQENRPPPPPRPPIPIEAPSDETLDDVTIGDTEINLAQDLAPPAPKSDDDDVDSYFVAVEEMPQLIGGMESIMRRVVYPELALRAGVQGKVFVVAFVNEKGEVVKAEVQKGIGAGCDEAAVAAVMHAKFIPGKQRGKPVKVRISIHIKFQVSS